VPEPLCFVVMPFGVKPAIRAAKFEPLRADQELVGGLVHKPMYERLVRAEGERALLCKALEAAREKADDSPVFQLIGDLPHPDIARLKTNVFREQAAYSAAAKQRLAAARAKGAGALREAEDELGPLEDVEAGVLIDLLLPYRGAEAWEDMTRLVEAMPKLVRRTLLVREQYGFALNRAGRSQDAESELLAVLEDHRESSETLGLLGRVFKDRWVTERGGSVLKAQGLLEKAIDAYRRGFEADWRDAYAGVNAVMLKEIREPGGAEQLALVPVVRFANRRRIEGGAPDYWDHATRLELGVAGRHPWEAKSTAYNLSLIRESRAERGEAVDWADEIERELRAETGRA
jgi:tetratricopeptide (TPR) repeat protein